VKKICLITTAEFIVHAFLIEPLRVLGREYDVSLVVNTENSHFLDEYGLNVRVIPMRIEREVRPFSDLAALFRLFFLFRRERFDVVHSFSPKAGLLSMLAGFLTAIPVRIHSLIGQVWATRRGLLRLLLKKSDQFTTRLATHLLSDSQSQVDFVVSEKIVKKGRVRVLGEGSIAGVDIERFKPDAQLHNDLRKKLGVPQQAKVVLFLGRIKKDKGVLDLAHAFAMLDDPQGQIWLWIVGPDEDDLKGEIKSICRDQRKRLCLHDYTRHAEHYMAAADVFCLPSYREGFGSSILEAAACGLPTVGSRIYGITDAIVENKTGLMFPVGDANSLAVYLQRVLDDEILRKQLGDAARQRVLNDFSSERVASLWLEFYKDALDALRV